jgi:hypothetical protein
MNQFTLHIAILCVCVANHLLETLHHLMNVGQKSKSTYCRNSISYTRKHAENNITCSTIIKGTSYA